MTATRGPMAADGLLSCRHEAVSTVENVRPRLVAGVLPVLVIWAVRWCPTPPRTLLVAFRAASEVFLVGIRLLRIGTKQQRRRRRRRRNT